MIPYVGYPDAFFFSLAGRIGSGRFDTGDATDDRPLAKGLLRQSEALLFLYFVYTHIMKYCKSI